MDTVLIGGEQVADIGTIIRQRRLRVGLTQDGLAKTSGLPHGTIVRIEGGGINPRLDTLEKIANGLGVTVAELLEDNGVKAG